MKPLWFSSAAFHRETYPPHTSDSRASLKKGQVHPSPFFWHYFDPAQHHNAVTQIQDIANNLLSTDGVRGEIFAQGLYAQGFKTIYLATGYEAERYPPMPWIKAIVGKDPPEW